MLQGLQDELQEERRRREEEIHQQGALQLSQAKAELQLVTERNAELQEEVCVCHCLCMCVANVSPVCDVQLFSQD